MTTVPNGDPRWLLVNWANSQDQWVRLIATEVLATRKALPDAAIDVIYRAFLAEKHLSQEAAPPLTVLELGERAEEASADLRLAGLTKVKGVNAIAGDQEIRFNPCLTILFGENAAGKTGYVRVLKRLASVRSAEEILGNVRVLSAAAPVGANIEFSVGSTSQTLEWKGEAGVPPLTRVSVFDSRSVTLHVDENLTYLYTPSDLALFRHTHDAINAVKARLDQERSDRGMKTNPFLPRFEREAFLYPKIETLGPSTDLSELERLGSVTSEEEQQAKTLRANVDSLRSQSTDSRIQIATSDRDLFAAIAATARAVKEFEWQKYTACLERVRVATERRAAASEKAFAEGSLPGVLTPTWQSFVQAAEEYISQIESSDFPQEGSACPYCRQELDQAALELVRKYRAYSGDTSKQEVDAARAELKQFGVRFGTIIAKAPTDALARRRASFEAAEVPPALVKASEFFGMVGEAHAAIVAAAAVNSSRLVTSADAVAVQAAREGASAEATIKLLKQQAAERDKILAEETAKLRLLQNRMVLKALLPDVRAAVQGAKWASQAGTVAARIPQILKQLTGEAKVASKELLNQDFERLFAEECEKLRAPKVTLDFSGRNAEAARRKMLSPDHRLSAILSEGEQKVIALADFLAEASLRRVSAPIVFDDPVNSLDYKRLQHVVDRIVELSSTHQIVVFTHNIWFATELLSRFEKRKGDCTYYNVVEEDGAVGIVREGTGPRWDTPKSIGTRINELIQAASKASGEIRAALVEKAYEKLRGWCEAAVEQEILSSVTRRYQPNVMMTKLPEIKGDRLAKATGVILPVFEKACRVISAHSQPLETLSVRPSLQDLETDWKTAREALEAYKK